MNPLVRPWRHLFDFRGRATRTEFWLFVPASIAALFAFFVVAGLVGRLVAPDSFRAGEHSVAIGIVVVIGYAVMAIAHVAIGVRRLHDHGDPGIKYLLNLIPFVGWIFWLIMAFAAGQEGDNDYGHDPRMGERASADELGSVFS